MPILAESTQPARRHRPFTKQVLNLLPEPSWKRVPRNLAAGLYRRLDQRRCRPAGDGPDVAVPSSRHEPTKGRGSRLAAAGTVINKEVHYRVVDRRRGDPIGAAEAHQRGQ